MRTAFLTQPGLWTLCLALAFGTLANAAPPLLPENLPEPPPLPPEMLAKRPLEPPPDLPDPSVLFAQLKQLEELLSLPAERLHSLRQTIEYIEKLSPDEREAMRLRLTQITRSTPELRDEINQLAVLLPKDLHSGLSQFWLAASPDERASLRAQLATLSDAQKTGLLVAKTEAFVKRREEIFAKMKDTLELRRREALDKQP